MSTKLRLATPGASEARCAICNDLTIYRVEVDDGVVPICCEACLRAWPRVLKMTNALRELVEAWGNGTCEEENYATMKQRWTDALIAARAVLNEISL